MSSGETVMILYWRLIWFLQLFYSERPGEERRHEMGKRRPGSGRRGVGRADLQIRCAVNGRMETAEELVEKVLNNYFF